MHLFHFRNVPGIVKHFFFGNDNKTNTKVDRIIFIASAKSENLPEELIKSVRFLALEGSRGNPMFKT